MSKLAIRAWEGKNNKSVNRARSASLGLKWDTDGYSPPNHPESDDEEEHGHGVSRSLEPQRSTGTPTSLYMTGSIAVGVVIVSGRRASVRLSTEEQEKVILEVQEGLDFLANVEPRAGITFVYDIHVVNVDVAAGPTTSYEAAEAPWRNAALASMGFSASRQGSIDYVNQLRAEKDTNWAYVAYFTKYPLHHFAYAVSEKTVMHYDNDGWGVDNISKVFAHETCHIFGAADEYGSCSCAGSHGFLGIPNKNCINCAGTQVPCLMNSNNLQMCEWTRGQLGWDEALFPTPEEELGEGVFTMQQKTNKRFLDAYESRSKDYSVVTRTAQNNATQRWKFIPVGNVYNIQQKSTGRFLDAFSSNSKDYNCVTRNSQNNDTQKWVVLPTTNHLGGYTLQQLSNGQYLDAWETSSKDFSAVTRVGQNNDTQKWIFHPSIANTYKLEHVINGRFLDAYENSSNDFSVITRTGSNNDDTQNWLFTPVGGVYKIQQLSGGQLLDAHEISSKDFSAVMRTPQNNDSQLFVILPSNNDGYTIQQLSTSRFLDAWTTTAKDYSAVTRTRQNNNTQKWIINHV